MKTEKYYIFGDSYWLPPREAIKQARKDRNLTQEQLGLLVGVKKAQISKLENSLTDARFETIIKVFKALNAKVNFNVELLNQTVKLA